MGRVVLVKDSAGDLRGHSAADERAYIRFMALCAHLQAGDTLSFSWAEPRSPGFHRAHFALLKLIFDSQETFDDPDELRAWLACGAGHCRFIAGAGGELIAIPRSIAYEKLDEADFREHHRRLIDFFRTPRAHRHLWAHLSAYESEHAVETILLAYEREEQQGNPAGGEEGEPIP